MQPSQPLIKHLMSKITVLFTHGYRKKLLKKAQSLKKLNFQIIIVLVLKMNFELLLGQIVRIFFLTKSNKTGGYTNLSTIDDVRNRQQAIHLGRVSKLAIIKRRLIESSVYMKQICNVPPFSN